MAAEERDTSKTAVRTYVPVYQRDIWDEHADDLDMSRSEFVRSMVQAGRRGFDPGGNGSETGPQDRADATESTDPAGPESDPDQDGSVATFDERVLELLDDECLSWEDLFEALTDDVEERLDETLQRLQASNEIQHSGREGGYVRVE
jgi:hypothetical protein